MRQIIGVIMAAGMGRRLMPLTKDTPKALIRVGDKELLGHVSDFLRLLGCSSNAVVAGYGFEQVREYVVLKDPQSIIINNPEYDKQNALSFRRALEGIEGDLLFADVDFVRHEESAASHKTEFGDDVVYFVSSEKIQDVDCMRVKIGEEGELADLAKGLAEFDAVSAGMLYIPDGYRSIFIAAADHVIEILGAENARLEDVLREAVRHGVKVKIKDVGEAAWLEIDTVDELARAEEVLKHRLGGTEESEGC